MLASVPWRQPVKAQYVSIFSPALWLIVGLVAFAGSAAGQDLRVERVASGLTAPIFAVAAPGDPNRLFIGQQGNNGGAAGIATIRILDLTTNTLLPTPFLTLNNIFSSGEEGLLGMAFDPDFATNGSFYLQYTSAFAVNKIDRFTVSGNPNIANPSSVNLMTIPQPNGTHNGGWIGFSPRAGDERNLYIAKGDGGGGGDDVGPNPNPGGISQNPEQLLGKMLRITVPAVAPAAGNPQYSIPSGNPFGNEVFDLGLRNPFRNSFDRQTGDLFIADVGAGAREEINVQKAAVGGIGGVATSGGENFGWKFKEGNLGMVEPPSYVGPVFDYPRSVGGTVIGGYVYRGQDIPSLNGTYIFGDFLGPNTMTGSTIFKMNYDGTTASGFADITQELFAGTGYTLQNVYSFGEDARGELYILDGVAGSVYKIVGELLGDVNFDHVVDIVDLTEVANYWLSTDARGDANHDGQVNIIDLTIIANHWLEKLPGPAVTPVPEPSTVALSAIAGVTLLAVSLRRRK